MIDVPCKGRLRDGTRCQEIYHAEESHVGKSLRCPICRTLNRIEREAPFRSYPATVGQVTSSAEEHANRRVTRLASGNRWKMAIVIGGATLAVFAVVATWIVRWPKPSAGVVPGASATAEPYGTVPPTGQRREVVPSASNQTSATQPAPNSRANASEPSLNPFEIVPSPPKGRADQLAIVPPCAQGQQAVRLPTGTRIEPDGEASGPSELSVSNGTTSDAAVRLVKRDSGNTAKFVYIAAGDNYTLTGIEPGTYGLRFISGRKWMPACSDFLDADYFEFESALVFKDVVLESGEENYNTMHVTLNPVPLGTAKTRRIDRNRFFESDQRFKPQR